MLKQKDPGSIPAQESKNKVWGFRKVEKKSLLLKCNFNLFTFATYFFSPALIFIRSLAAQDLASFNSSCLLLLFLLAGGNFLTSVFPTKRDPSWKKWKKEEREKKFGFQESRDDWKKTWLQRRLRKSIFYCEMQNDRDSGLLRGLDIINLCYKLLFVWQAITWHLTS